jgi:probable rRNA maturation factor
MVEVSNTTRQPLAVKEIEAITAYFLKVFKKSSFDVSIAIIGSARMRRLNDDYRGQNKTTDVLSFAAAGWEKKLLGEIIINPQEIKRWHLYGDILMAAGFSVRELKHSDKIKRVAERYLFYFILVHGLFHLLGDNDEREIDRQAMLRRGREFLKKAEKNAIIRL